MSAYSSYNEKELLKLVAAGDAMAFAKLVQQYTSIIFHHLTAQLHDQQLAQDLTQNIFISLWQNREKLPEIENFSGYVYAAARNTSYKSFLQRVSQTSLLQDDKLPHLLEQPSTNVEFKELQHILNQGIAALPPRRREVFELSRFENMTYEEIAAKLKISRNAVKQHIVAAKVFLRVYLKEHAGIVISLLLAILLW